MNKTIEKQVIESLQGLVRIESVESKAAHGMPFGKGINDALEYFLNLAAKLGLQTKNYDGYAGEIILEASGHNGGGGVVLSACIDGSTTSPPPCVAVLVHLDTVPAGDGWTHPPFSGVVKGGKMYGRGVMDDKGAAVVSLYVLKRLQGENAPRSKTIKLIAGCDEESGQLCMKHYKKHAQMPEIGFSPDADFPVINCEKTILQLKLNICADKVFAALVESIECGNRPNVVPDTAEARLCGGSVLKFKGKAAHSMVAFEGDNAAHKLVKALQDRAGKGKSAALDFLAGFLCDTDGKALGINARDEKSGELTMNFASLKYGKTNIEAVLDLRCPLSVDVEKLVDTIQCTMMGHGDTVPDPACHESFPHDPYMPETNAQCTMHNAQLEVLYRQPGIYVDPESELVKTLLGAYEKVTGKKGKCIISGGGTYARHLKRGVAFGPAEKNSENNVHSADEFIEIAQLETMYDIYYEAIKELVK